MPGRQSTPDAYRYGFNGQEKDDEIANKSGAHTTAMFWEYDARLGRRWNTDPINIPFYSPYACFNNTPTLLTDLNGDFASRKEARQYKKEHGSPGRINKNQDGTFSIDDKKSGITLYNDPNAGIIKGPIITATKNPNTSTGRDDRRDGDRRRRWRNGNYRRGSNLSPFDERGRELLGRWLNGSGKKLTTNNGNWGDYMKNNQILREQIIQILEDDASTRTSNGSFDFKGYAEIENGYNTGYEMLHGTNNDVDGFQIHGTATVTNSGTVEYNLKIAWHDIIDPNPVYDNDVILSDLLNKAYSPKDYEVHILWNEKITVE